MDKVVPWAKLCTMIEPCAPVARVEGGRHPSTRMPDSME
jgi:hypothetical protein